MQYAFFMYNEVGRDTTDEEMQGHFAFSNDVDERGISVAGEALQPETIMVRTSDTRGVVTDGPFAETREVLGGFYVLECKDRDEAIEFARKLNAIDDCTVEIRPIWKFN
jgi:hypothetical protein